MKNLTILLLTVLLFAAGSFAQQQSYNPFSINELKTGLRSSELEKSVSDAKIVDVNFDVVKEIISRRDDKINISLPFEGRNLAAALTKFDITNGNTRFTEGTTAGDIILQRKNDYVSYTSDLKDKNSPLVVVTFFKNDVTALIITEQETYVFAKISNSNDFIAYKSSKLKIRNEFKCGTDELGIPDKITEIQKSLSGNVQNLATSTLLKANIAVESDFEFYTYFGNSVERATNYIISLYVPVSAIYTRDVNVKLEVTYTRVWSTSADPYPDATSSNTLLNSFRNYWNANMQSVPRTIAHFISTRPGGLGGIAWVNVLCATGAGSYGYAFSDVDGTFNQLPVYSWDCMVVAHETGHNFGSPHTHSCTWPGGPIDSCYTVEGGCYSGPQIARVGTVMSYCHLNGSIALFFGPLPSELIRQRAEFASCMTSITGYLVATPNGGQVFRSGNPTLVIWGTSNLGNVDIDYSLNNGSTWSNLQTNVDATLRNITWTIPYVPTTTQALIRVYQSGNTANGDVSDSTFQIRPTLNAFNLLNPPQLHSTYVSAGDTSNIHFTFSKAGTLPEVKYNFILSTINNQNVYRTLTNNSGSDSVFSISRSKLDSIVSTWGAANVGDSLRVRWNVYAYTQFDSNTTSPRLITFLRSVIGISPISTIVPDKFFINPNYPNPFNPETKIRFGLPANADVKISVFDMLGREVDVLVNSKLEAGEYLADWNAVNFSSGIYIYRIEARDIRGNSFTETRKMVLVK
ncbi:MAG TPA: M12 family metallo-peptidase [Ignavibacteria bacterium]|nr:hypothetical protein [Bacteroidota bacterium]HRE12220.1 M12 family metallo-peptidase [Ignavibacteria bacterium]HRF66553.1 M12 family metallo-peptidase [Ignavibacteria bacterium]HRJ03718.1 M12 family metallo-peptidase [Ignavibacteria bacterium]